MTVFLAYASNILGGTPLWVWALFLYLMIQGARRLRPRVVDARRLAIVPFIFIAWGLSGLASRPFDAGTIALCWIAGAVFGGILGPLTGPKLLAADRTRTLAHLPGSKAPLIRNIVIFGSHYALNVAAAILPAMAGGLLRADIAVSGASAGYFIGWGVSLWRSWQQAPAMSLAAA
jgi:hypothetical protein